MLRLSVSSKNLAQAHAPNMYMHRIACTHKWSVYTKQIDDVNVSSVKVD